MPDNNKWSNEERLQMLADKTEELAEEQEKNLVTDYDKALKEYKEKNKSYQVKFKGNVYEVPASMPFKFGLFYMRNCIKKIDGKTLFVVPDDKLDEFIILMFGRTFLESLQEDDQVELNFIIKVLIPDIMDKWGYNVSSKEEVGKN